MTNANIDMDFSVEEEYVEEPLIPQGTYNGNVTNVSYDAEKLCIIWQVALADNGGFMNDDSTPIDGAVVLARNYLPKPGDEDKMDKNGRLNTRQWKIKMLKRFADDLSIDMGTPAKIMEGINEAQWVGMNVNVTLEIREYQGQFSNDVRRLVAVE
jgi:hypothetical protein